MAEDGIPHPTIAHAEQAIVERGYLRDRGRALWVNMAGKTAKVTRKADGKFYVDWS